MKEKEKAKELVDKYLLLFKKTDSCFLEHCNTKVYCQHSDFQCKGWLQFANESAKIAVNEIILHNYEHLEGDKYHDRLNELEQLIIEIDNI